MSKRVAYYCEVCQQKFHGTFHGKESEMYLCCKHLHQMSRYGRIFKRTIADKNEIINKGLYSEIALYNKVCDIVAYAIIDSVHVDKVKTYKWVAVKKGKSLYVKTDLSKDKNNGKRKTLYLSNLILGKKKKYQIDHISGDTLDNRKSNLRFVTQQQNLMNKHLSKGYSHEKSSKLWHTYIGVKNKRINIGRFKTEKEAKEKRRQAELKYYGRFAKQE